jgi:hypothetical protein
MIAYAPKFRNETKFISFSLPDSLEKLKCLCCKNVLVIGESLFSKSEPFMPRLRVK